jgi:hypothetical protein
LASSTVSRCSTGNGGAAIRPIRYGNSANSCTMTSAPNYTEEGQYTVYYEITYTYKNTNMTENGVAYVWLRDETISTDSNGNSTCTCGCKDPNCGCQDKNCGGNCCTDKGCGDNHTLLCWSLSPRPA